MSAEQSNQPEDRSNHGMGLRLLAYLAVISGAGLWAYHESFAGVFLFDDRLHILGDRRLSEIWPLWEALSHKRPVVDYSLAVNYAISGEKVFAYHATNLVIHILAAMTLFGIVRRTASLVQPAARVDRQHDYFGLAVALLWMLHPLQTQSVTYVIQRAESLMGLFYLLTLYSVIRGAQSPRSSAFYSYAWYSVAIISSALGMGSKGVMVTVPLAVLLYDRLFLARTLTELFRRRGLLYAGLLGTWGVLWLSGVGQGVLNPSNRRANVGFGYKGASPLEYLQTQCSVLTEYLKLSIWPRPLCLDYTWPLAKTASDFVPTGLAILCVLGLTVWCLVYRRTLGFACAWIFIVLAPTSSIVPIKDALFEHRMYLPLAGVLVVGTLGMVGAVRWVSQALSIGRRGEWVLRTGLFLVAATVLGFGTDSRNKVYQSEAGMWGDVRNKRPNSARAAENYGTALLAEGRVAEAMVALREAVAIAPRSAEVHNGLGFALVAQGRVGEAIPSFREALRLKPAHPRARINLGNALSDTGDLEGAMSEFQRAIRFNPKNHEARLNFGNGLLRQGRVDEAIIEYRKILETDPEHASAWGNLGSALLNRGRVDEAVDALRRAIAVNPDSHNAHNSLGIALASRHELESAIQEFQRALALRPNMTGAHFNLGGCLGEKGNYAGAVDHYRAAIASQPGNVEAHYELGRALRTLGRTNEATAAFRQTLRLSPGHQGARKALEGV